MKKISELLNTNKPCVSCEVFPPKPGVCFDGIQNVVSRLSESKPKFISVTYGASGSNSDRTIEVAEEIQKNGIPALAHMTCVCADKQKVESTLDAYKAKGISNILALRGDIPQGMDPDAKREYTYAYQLIEKIKEYDSSFCIGAACYPEGHVECLRKEDDLDHLKMKVDAGCEFMTTQMFFNNDILYHFMYRAHAKGIDIPLVAGIMPITNTKQIGRTVSLSGTYLPPRFKAIAEKFEGKPEAMMQAGIAYATEQIIDLIANGINRIHIYTMNKPEIAAAIFNNLSYIIED